jgi:hypothetical protein
VTINAAVAAAIVVGAIAVGAGVTYMMMKTSVRVDCPSPAQRAAPPQNRGIPLGAPLPEHQGQKF